MYAAESASEFHQVLIYALEKAAEAVVNFTNTYKTGELLAHKMLTAVEIWMRYLYVMVHDSAIFRVHVEALDGDITELMENPLPRTRAQTRDLQTKLRDDLNGKSNNPDANIRSATQNEDYDGGLSDTAIEIAAAQGVSRAGQQSLWLAVSFQHAIRSVCRQTTLPKVHSR